MNLPATILVLAVIAAAVSLAIVRMRRGRGCCGSRRVSGGKCTSCSNRSCPFCN